MPTRQDEQPARRPMGGGGERSDRSRASVEGRDRGVGALAPVGTLVPAWTRLREEIPTPGQAASAEWRLSCRSRETAVSRDISAACRAAASPRPHAGTALALTATPTEYVPAPPAPRSDRTGLVPVGLHLVTGIQTAPASCGESARSFARANLTPTSHTMPCHAHTVSWPSLCHLSAGVAGVPALLPPEATPGGS